MDGISINADVFLALENVNGSIIVPLAVIGKALQGRYKYIVRILCQEIPCKCNGPVIVLLADEYIHSLRDYRFAPRP